MLLIKFLHTAFSPRYMFIKGIILFILLVFAMALLRRESVIPERSAISMGSRQVAVTLF